MVVGLKSRNINTKTVTEMKFYRFSSESHLSKGVWFDIDTYRISRDGSVKGPFKDPDHHLKHSIDYFEEFFRKLKNMYSELS